MAIRSLIKEVALLLYVIGISQAERDLLDTIRLNADNPPEVNDFLHAVLQYRNDFKWIRRLAQQSDKLYKKSIYITPANQMDFLKKATQSPQPANDISHYTYDLSNANKPQNVYNLRRPIRNSRRKRKRRKYGLVRRRRSKGSVNLDINTDQDNGVVKIVPRSETGVQNVPGQKYYGRHRKSADQVDSSQAPDSDQHDVIWKSRLAQDMVEKGGENKTQTCVQAKKAFISRTSRNISSPMLIPQQVKALNPVVSNVQQAQPKLTQPNFGSPQFTLPPPHYFTQQQNAIQSNLSPIEQFPKSDIPMLRSTTSIVPKFIPDTRNNDFMKLINYIATPTKDNQGLNSKQELLKKDNDDLLENIDHVLKADRSGLHMCRGDVQLLTKKDEAISSTEKPNDMFKTLDNHPMMDNLFNSKRVLPKFNYNFASTKKTRSVNKHDFSSSDDDDSDKEHVPNVELKFNSHPLHKFKPKKAANRRRANIGRKKKKKSNRRFPFISTEPTTSTTLFLPNSGLMFTISSTGNSMVNNPNIKLLENADDDNNKNLKMTLKEYINRENAYNLEKQHQDDDEEDSAFDYNIGQQKKIELEDLTEPTSAAEQRELGRKDDPTTPSTNGDDNDNQFIVLPLKKQAPVDIMGYRSADLETIQSLDSFRVKDSEDVIHLGKKDSKFKERKNPNSIQNDILQKQNKFQRNNIQSILNLENDFDYENTQKLDPIKQNLDYNYYENFEQKRDVSKFKARKLQNDDSYYFDFIDMQKRSEDDEPDEEPGNDAKEPHYKPKKVQENEPLDLSPKIEETDTLHMDVIDPKRRSYADSFDLVDNKNSNRKSYKPSINIANQTLDNRDLSISVTAIDDLQVSSNDMSDQTTKRESKKISVHEKVSNEHKKSRLPKKSTHAHEVTEKSCSDSNDGTTCVLISAKPINLSDDELESYRDKARTETSESEESDDDDENDIDEIIKSKMKKKLKVDEREEEVKLNQEETDVHVEPQKKRKMKGRNKMIFHNGHKHKFKPRKHQYNDQDHFQDLNKEKPRKKMHQKHMKFDVDDDESERQRPKVLVRSMKSKDEHDDNNNGELELFKGSDNYEKNHYEKDYFEQDHFDNNHFEKDHFDNDHLDKHHLDDDHFDKDDFDNNNFNKDHFDNNHIDNDNFEKGNFLKYDKYGDKEDKDDNTIQNQEEYEDDVDLFEEKDNRDNDEERGKEDKDEKGGQEETNAREDDERYYKPKNRVVVHKHLKKMKYRKPHNQDGYEADAYKKSKKVKSGKNLEKPKNKNPRIDEKNDNGLERFNEYEDQVSVTEEKSDDDEPDAFKESTEKRAFIYSDRTPELTIYESKHRQRSPTLYSQSLQNPSQQQSGYTSDCRMTTKTEPPNTENDQNDGGEPMAAMKGAGKVYNLPKDDLSDDGQDGGSDEGDDDQSVTPTYSSTSINYNYFNVTINMFANAIDGTKSTNCDSKAADVDVNNESDDEVQELTKNIIALLKKGKHKNFQSLQGEDEYRNKSVGEAEKITSTAERIHTKDNNAEPTGTFESNESQGDLEETKAIELDNKPKMGENETNERDDDDTKDQDSHRSESTKDSEEQEHFEHGNDENDEPSNKNKTKALPPDGREEKPQKLASSHNLKIQQLKKKNHQDQSTDGGNKPICGESGEGGEDNEDSSEGVSSSPTYSDDSEEKQDEEGNADSDQDSNDGEEEEVEEEEEPQDRNGPTQVGQAASSGDDDSLGSQAAFKLNEPTSQQTESGTSGILGSSTPSSATIEDSECTTAFESAHKEPIKSATSPMKEEPVEEAELLCEPKENKKPIMIKSSTVVHIGNKPPLATSTPLDVDDIIPHTIGENDVKDIIASRLYRKIPLSIFDKSQPLEELAEQEIFENDQRSALAKKPKDQQLLINNFANLLNRYKNRLTSSLIRREIIPAVGPHHSENKKKQKNIPKDPCVNQEASSKAPDDLLNRELNDKFLKNLLSLNIIKKHTKRSDVDDDKFYYEKIIPNQNIIVPVLSAAEEEAIKKNYMKLKPEEYYHEKRIMKNSLIPIIRPAKEAYKDIESLDEDLKERLLFQKVYDSVMRARKKAQDKDVYESLDEYFENASVQVDDLPVSSLEDNLDNIEIPVKRKQEFDLLKEQKKDEDTTEDTGGGLVEVSRPRKKIEQTKRMMSKTISSKLKSTNENFIKRKSSTEASKIKWDNVESFKDVVEQPARVSLTSKRSTLGRQLKNLEFAESYLSPLLEDTGGEENIRLRRKLRHLRQIPRQGPPLNRIIPFNYNDFIQNHRQEQRFAQNMERPNAQTDAVSFPDTQNTNEDNAISSDFMPTSSTTCNSQDCTDTTATPTDGFDVSQNRSKAAEEEEQKKKEREDMRSMLNGDLPMNIINIFYGKLKDNNGLYSRFGGSITGSKEGSYQNVINIKSFREEQAKVDIKHAEEMLHEVIVMLNKIVADQVHRKTCLKLSPNLKLYIIRITRGMRNFKKNNQISEGYPLPKIKNRSNQEVSPPPEEEQGNLLFEDDGIEYKATMAEKSKIQKRINLIQKLLEKYERMSMKCQVQVEPVRNYLVNHLQVLMDLLGKNANGQTSCPNHVTAAKEGLTTEGEGSTNNHIIFNLHQDDNDITTLKQRSIELSEPESEIEHRQQVLMETQQDQRKNEMNQFTEYSKIERMETLKDSAVGDYKDYRRDDLNNNNLYSRNQEESLAVSTLPSESSHFRSNPPPPPPKTPTPHDQEPKPEHKPQVIIKTGRMSDQLTACDESENNAMKNKDMSTPHPGNAQPQAAYSYPELVTKDLMQLGLGGGNTYLPPFSVSGMVKERVNKMNTDNIQHVGSTCHAQSHPQGVPQNSAPQNIAPQNIAPQNSAPQNSAPQNIQIAHTNFVPQSSTLIPIKFESREEAQSLSQVSPVEYGQVSTAGDVQLIEKQRFKRITNDDSEEDSNEEASSKIKKLALNYYQEPIQVESEQNGKFPRSTIHGNIFKKEASTIPPGAKEINTGKEISTEESHPTDGIIPEMVEDGPDIIPLPLQDSHQLQNHDHGNLRNFDDSDYLWHQNNLGLLNERQAQVGYSERSENVDKFSHTNTNWTGTDKYKKLLQAYETLRDKRDNEDRLTKLYVNKEDDKLTLKTASKQMHDISKVNFEKPLVFSLD